MTREEHEKIIHLMNHGALHDIDTGRLDGRGEDAIPLEDAIAIIDLVYKDERVKNDKRRKSNTEGEDKKKSSLWWKCERCGKLIPYMADFCNECAYELLGEPPKPFEPPKVDKENEI